MSSGFTREVGMDCSVMVWAVRVCGLVALPRVMMGGDGCCCSARRGCAPVVGSEGVLFTDRPASGCKLELARYARMGRSADLGGVDNCPLQA